MRFCKHSVAILTIATFMYFSKASIIRNPDNVNVEAGVVLGSRIAIPTETSFKQEKAVEHEPISFETEYIFDDEKEVGAEDVVVKGKDGTKTLTYLVTYWGNKTINKELISTEVVVPTTEKIAKGTKIIWHELDVPEHGIIRYWKKIRVFATKYDSTCKGCNNTTALGAPVQEGVCAVDPSVISMYTHFYVPGYGECQALDVGGLVKGNRIDLAYKNAFSAPWGAEYVDIYLMDNTP